MSLPNPDPSLPNATNPYFQDNGFVRGDQLRNNNAQIWSNLTFLDNKQLIFQNYQLLISGTTWTNPDPSTIFYVFAHIVGAGGGGAGGSSTTPEAGGGGAGGQEIWRLISVGSSVSYTIGTGGTAGSVNNIGGSGGSTIFGSDFAYGGNGAGNAAVSPTLLLLGGSAANSGVTVGWAGQNSLFTSAFSLGGSGGGQGGGRGPYTAVGASRAAIPVGANSGGGGYGGCGTISGGSIVATAGGVGSGGYIELFF